MSELHKLEQEVAVAALPANLKLIASGVVQPEDYIWSFMDQVWTKVKPAKPFVKGQKRPGWKQLTDIGQDVTKFVAVARAV